MNEQPARHRANTTLMLSGLAALAVALSAGVYYLGASATSARFVPAQADPAESGDAQATVMQTLDLRTEDRPGGYLAILDGSNDRILQVLGPAEGGFMRPVLRIIMLDRRTEEEKRSPSLLRLTRWSNGSLTLEDPATGLRYELNAFGPTNAGAFARLLDIAKDS
ncbi:photosynthetic complex assembly protein PuhC [Ectothiorhodospira shaposhnikovii]|uniref:photosynthetic complex assembly protein PuhC n=1 Tax=Ectothiorhodospira shaposhnikovii TaxID=1054 RepID=UPI001908E2A0|nr:photosynthetic complex assembly protein PuhC [Ectothiorhodospira shaposhnikovii]